VLLCIESVLDAAELDAIRGRLAGASWVDGRATAGSLGVAVKSNRQLDAADPVATELGNRILARLGRNALFVSAALPQRIFPPHFNRYEGGGHYGVHVDGSVMYHAALDRPLRSDVSATLFLADPADYDGGELCVETPFAVQEVKLAAGDLVLYPSSSLHEVKPVTRGARLACFFWVQSLVRDAERRGRLFDLDQSVQQLTARLGGTDPEVLRLSGVYHNLMRQWAET
jgi:PKHD-type hydroxylase